MSRRRSCLGLFAAVALAGIVPGAVVAQGEPAAPEGQTWELAAYAAEDGMATVPEDVAATLSLVDGTASGSAGCHRFSGGYVLDGAALTVAPEVSQTMLACDPAVQAVEDAYLALLPTTASWRASGGALQLHDAGGAVILEYASSAPDLLAVIALLEALRADVAGLEARIDALESVGAGDGAADAGTGVGAAQTASPPAAPRSRGSVETVFPDWMRDGRPPDEIADKNREVVRWRDRADDEDGYRVYARRGFCQLKPGTDPNQLLDERDFRRSRSGAVRIDQLPADATRYRPDHAAIDDALPEAPVSPYSNDQFYDLYVAAFNDAGESKRVLVGSFYLTPEFRCP